MKKSLLLIFLCATLCAGSPAVAEERETHSAYKVTTYNLGALLGEQGGSKLSLQNYEPLLITSTKADILSVNPAKMNKLKGTSQARTVKGFAIAAEYSATPDIAVHGVLGITQNTQTSSSFDTDASWEANLGLIYRFFNNLSYEVHFGYMDTGNLLKERSSYSNDESIIMISNKLTLSF